MDRFIKDLSETPLLFGVWYLVFCICSLFCFIYLGVYSWFCIVGMYMVLRITIDMRLKHCCKADDIKVHFSNGCIAAFVWLAIYLTV
jgi:hypothetical protein